MTRHCVTVSGAWVVALALSHAAYVASVGASAAQARAPWFDDGQRWVSALEGVPGVVERVVVLPAPRLCGRRCWVSASEGVPGVVERVVVLPARRCRHLCLVRCSFVADLDSTFSEPASVAYLLV
jgi:hypothetical protein